MKYISEISLLFEAKEYLTHRFSSIRIADRLARIRENALNMSNINWACFEKISRLEKMLDDAVPADDLMKFYFKPWNESANEVDAEPSLGSAILWGVLCLNENASVDTLIAFYNNISKADLLTGMLGSLLTGASNTNVPSVENMEEFVAGLNDHVTDAGVKWNLLDIAVDPIKHLQILRQTIETVANKISEYSELFIESLNTANELYADGRIEEQLPNFHVLMPADNKEIIIRPSIFLFNSMTFMVLGSERTAWVSIGVFADTVFKLWKQRDSASAYITALKTLSDQNRLETLKFLRDNSSYGQELAEKFGVTRNAMYYHLDKLLQIGFIDCLVDEYKSLYTMNKRRVYDYITGLKQYLLGDWEPDTAGNVSEGSEAQGSDDNI